MKDPDFDQKEFWNRRYWALNFSALIGDVQDFLEFSESNIAWQHRAAVQAIARDISLRDLPGSCREQLLSDADHRLLTALPMRVRYAALIALVTTVEWEARTLRKQAGFEITKCPDRMNHAAHTLRRYDAAMALGPSEVIDNYERLVHVRNPIAHSGGIVSGWKYEEEIRQDIDRLEGFSIGTWHFIGESVRIKRGALSPYIRQTGNLIPKLWDDADKAEKRKSD